MFKQLLRKVEFSNVKGIDFALQVTLRASERTQNIFNSGTIVMFFSRHYSWLKYFKTCFWSTYTFNLGWHGLAWEFRGLPWDTSIDTCQEPCKVCLFTLQALFGPAADPPGKWQPFKSPGKLDKRSISNSTMHAVSKTEKQLIKYCASFNCWRFKKSYIDCLFFFQWNIPARSRTSYSQVAHRSWKTFGEFIF